MSKAEFNLEEHLKIRANEVVLRIIECGNPPEELIYKGELAGLKALAKAAGVEIRIEFSLGDLFKENKDKQPNIVIMDGSGRRLL